MQQRALARAAMAHDRPELPRADFKAHAPQRVHPSVSLAVSLDGVFNNEWGHAFLKSLKKHLMAPRWAGKGPDTRRTSDEHLNRYAEGGQRSRRAFSGPSFGRHSFGPHSASLLLSV